MTINSFMHDGHALMAWYGWSHRREAFAQQGDVIFLPCQEGKGARKERGGRQAQI